MTNASATTSHSIVWKGGTGMDLRSTGTLTLVLFLFACMSGPAQGRQIAQPVSPQLTAEQMALEAELKTELVCVCGTCPRIPIGSCNCPNAAHMRDQLATQMALGKGRDGIFQFFIDAYGSQEPLGTPMGAFNQLVWLLPLSLGMVGFIVIVRVAVRWSRRGGGREPVLAVPGDTLLHAQLDDELRNLD